MKIPLTQGKFAVVDEEDADLFAEKWFVRCAGDAVERWYVGRNSKSVNYGKRHMIHLHRVILARKLGRSLENGEFVDHINHDGLDNRRENLRLATKQENGRNRRTDGGSKSSKYKGVTWNKRERKWRAQIGIDGSRTHLGYFRSERDAALAYDEYAKELNDPFYKLNFPE